MSQLTIFLFVFFLTLWVGDTLLTLCAIKAAIAEDKRSIVKARIAKVLSR